MFVEVSFVISYCLTESLLSTCLLFLSTHDDHRYLHSFPTRRSSDLQSRSSKRRSVCGPLTVDTEGTLARSEEHTSELQSLTNLVCRLLLEKKKKSRNRIAYE